jgi:hypothetical protein
LGLFTDETISADTIVGELGGVTFSEKQIKAREHKRGSVIQIDEHLWMGYRPGDPDSPDDMLNHSCDPNLWLSGKTVLVARHEIAAGEELTVDYAVWTDEPEWRFPCPCNCGSRLCRIDVTGLDWKRPELQKRYAGHFSPFLNEKILRLNVDAVGGSK